MPSSPALPGRPRTAGRLARTPELAAALAARLTARDRWLLRMLHEHRVLTTTQITDLTANQAAALAASQVPHAVHMFSRGPHSLGLAEGAGEAGIWTTLASAWLKEQL